MVNLKISQTLVGLKEAQTAFKSLASSTKIAMDDQSMGMNDKDMMIEKIFQQAEALVDTAITAVETVDAGNGMNDMGNHMNNDGGVDPNNVVSTDIPDVIDDPNKKINTAMGDHHDDNDPIKSALDELNDRADKQEKELDAMRHKEAQMKLAQKYSDLHPLAMRTAKFNEFMGHKGNTAVLEARLDEATVFMSKPNALMIAQQEDSVFNFQDLDSTSSRNVSTGSKI